MNESRYAFFLLACLFMNEMLLLLPLPLHINVNHFIIVIDTLAIDRGEGE
jgi:hypothetical protein